MAQKIILASNSPRRQNLLKAINIDFEVLASDVEEDYPDDMPVQEVPAYLARKKARAVQSKFDSDTMVIGADTVVILENEILGKPEDKADAKNILQQLSGKKHTVITAVCIIHNDDEKMISDATDVYFHPLKEQEIDYYLDHYQPYDKAGSYAIQEWIGMIGIKKIDGDYFNVMGLPVSKVYRYLQQL